MNIRQYSINEHTHTFCTPLRTRGRKKRKYTAFGLPKPMNNDTPNEIQIIHFSCSWCSMKWAHLYIESSNLYLIFWNCNNNNFSVSFIPLSFGSIESWISCSVICEMSLWFIWFNFYLFLHIQRHFIPKFQFHKARSIFQANDCTTIIPMICVIQMWNKQFGSWNS